MTVRILLLSLVCLFANIASAKTIHLLVFTDENDETIGTSCAETHKYFSKTFVPDLKRYTGLTVVEKYCNGSRFTVANLNDALSGLNTNSSDVIIFYYAGHGYNRGYNEYPTLTLGVGGSIAQRSKDLLDVYNNLKNKPHQLLLCIAEACNAVHRVNGIVDNIIVSLPSHVFSTAHFRELFNDAAGDYMVSSSIKGQKSYSAEGSPGMFTCGFREAFNEIVETSYAGIATWPVVFNKAIGNTEHIAMESGHTQTPQWIEGNYSSDIFDIEDIYPKGLDENKSIVGDVPVFASDIAQLQFNVKYSSSKDVELLYKLSGPQGIMARSDSPQGYTWNIKLPAGSNSIYKHNWGWASKGYYKPGKYKYELFRNGELVYVKNFSLLQKADGTGFLTVDEKASVSASFTYSGGERTFYVSTDRPSFTIEYLPSWCTLVNQGADAFTIRCESNTSSSSRSDWFKVRSGDKSVRIDVKQSANENTISGKIDNIWVEHNVVEYVGYQMFKGMRIHVKFTVNNMLGKTGNLIAYFYFQDGSKLVDYNGQFRAKDGQVCLGRDFTPDYINTVFTDCALFMPYSELHCGAGINYLKFQVCVFEKTSGSWRQFASSDYVNFSFTSY